MVRRKRDLLWGRAGGREGGGEKSESWMVNCDEIGNFRYVHYSTKYFEKSGGGEEMKRSARGPSGGMYNISDNQAP